MIKKYTLVMIAVSLAVILSAAAFLISIKISSAISKNIVSKTQAEKIHYHAGFIIFSNGKKLDFSDNKYMFIKPCTVDGKEIEVEGDEQIEKAHLHDNVGDLVHVEEKDAKWRDLFMNIKFPIDYSKTTAYINGKVVPDFQSQQINLDDSLVLFIGKVDTRLLSQGVTKDYIEAQAAKSGTCSD